jgi:hypothetical protein
VLHHSDHDTATRWGHDHADRPSTARRRHARVHATQPPRTPPPERYEDDDARQAPHRQQPQWEDKNKPYKDKELQDPLKGGQSNTGTQLNSRDYPTHREIERERDGSASPTHLPTRARKRAPTPGPYVPIETTLLPATFKISPSPDNPSCKAGLKQPTPTRSICTQQQPLHHPPMGRHHYVSASSKPCQGALFPAAPSLGRRTDAPRRTWRRPSGDRTRSPSALRALIHLPVLRGFCAGRPSTADG